MCTTALVLLAVAGLWQVMGLLPAASGVTEKNYERIEQGMTLTEVESVLSQKAAMLPSGEGVLSFAWDGSEGTVYADFNQRTGQLVYASYHHKPLTLLDRLRRLLPW
jgi:hypothetical protein